MTLNDLLVELGPESFLGFILSEFRLFSGNRDSAGFARSYGMLYGFLRCLVEQDVISALDFASIIHSLSQEGGAS
ncbi:MAG: hypothetical protein NC305_04030 [Lachnospiraceae bacterium]|nr:hypothetical protein [Muribaculaceae bacterium]MCM1409700.1 hypothetical protein [Lachnospiraceae bacterium]